MYNSYLILKIYLQFEQGKRGREGSLDGTFVLTMSASPTAHNSKIIKATRAKDIFTATITMIA
jgi:hypothetical protein